MVEETSDDVRRAAETIINADRPNKPRPVETAPNSAKSIRRLMGYPVGAAFAVLAVWLVTGQVHYGVVLGSVIFVLLLAGSYRLRRYLAASRNTHD